MKTTSIIFENMTKYDINEMTKEIKKALRNYKKINHANIIIDANNNDYKEWIHKIGKLLLSLKYDTTKYAVDIMGRFYLFASPDYKIEIEINITEKKYDTIEIKIEEEK